MWLVSCTLYWMIEKNESGEMWLNILLQKHVIQNILPPGTLSLKHTHLISKLYEFNTQQRTLHLNLTVLMYKSDT